MQWVHDRFCRSVGNGRCYVAYVPAVDAHHLARCDVPLRLYCFGIDRQSSLALPETDGVRMAFVSAARLPGDMGLAGADAACNAEGRLAFGSDRTFKAFLATRGRSARSRLSLDGPTWARPDGVRLVDRAGDLRADRVLTSISFYAFFDPNNPRNDHVNGGFVWTGAYVGIHCDSWQSAERTGSIAATTGVAEWLRSPWTRPCATRMSVYCFED